MHKKGFTLAELVITIGIIGIIASLTIPPLVQSAREKQTISSLKENYSILANAYNNAVQDNTPVSDWTQGSAVTQDKNANFFSAFSPYLQLAKYCGRGTGCFPTGTYKRLNGLSTTNFDDVNTLYAKSILANGSLIAVDVTNPSCTNTEGFSAMLTSNGCGYLTIDINGFKGPNQFGIDTFKFIMTKTRLVPKGMTGSFGGSSFENVCKMDQYGDTCTAWVLFIENMEYTKCSNLSWSGPTKCTP
jgi:prepilin-type N-terminal cleavage/methylation domain-containing protein